MKKTKYIKQANYRLVCYYPDGPVWDLPAFSVFSVDQKNAVGPDNYFWGTEEEWDAIPDGTEIFPPEKEPQITEQSSRLEIMDFATDEMTTLDPTLVGMGYLDLTDNTWKTIKAGTPPPPPDPIVESVIDGYRQRSKRGIEKYGTNLQDNNTDDFLQHLQEELMDAVLYIQKLKAQNAQRINELGAL